MGFELGLNVFKSEVIMWGVGLGIGEGDSSFMEGVR